METCTRSRSTWDKDAAKHEKNVHVSVNVLKFYFLDFSAVSFSQNVTLTPKDVTRK